MESNTDLIWELIYKDIPHNDQLTDNINSVVKEGYILILEKELSMLKSERNYYKRLYEKTI